MTANPLSNHDGPYVNAIVEDSGLKIQTKVDEVKSSMEKVYKVLVKIRVILKKEVHTKEKKERDCYYHYYTACIGHNIQECEDFRKILQAMMDRWRLNSLKKCWKNQLM